MRWIALLFIILTIHTSGQEITLDDLFKKGTFRGDFVSGFNSMADGVHYTTLENGSITKYKFSDGSLVGVIADSSDLKYDGKKINVEEYNFSNDEKYIVLLTNGNPIYRYSATHDAFIMDLTTKKIIRIDQDPIMHATLSPDNKWVAFVKKNNLFIYNISSGKSTQITHDGKWNHIINGNCDWVYEEEFGFTKAFEWRPDSKEIAYYKFDESEVKEFNFAIYDGLYPTDYRFKYPKAGEANSKLGIFRYSIETGQSEKLKYGNDDDIYIPRIKYNTSNNALLLFKLNRHQNHLEIYSYDPGAAGKIIYTEKNKYFIDIRDDYQYSKNKMYYVSEKSGYNHIYELDLNTGISKQLTNGKWEVTDFYGIDDRKGEIYYSSTESSPLERKLYKQSLKKGKKTCITPEPGTHVITFNSNLSYFLHTHSSLNTPPTYTLRDNNGKLIRELKSNATLKATMAKYNLAKQELIQVPNGKGDLLNAWILKPNNINDGKKHPLLMYQYSGPGSQEVANRWIGRDYFWYQMLAQKGYVIAVVDGRGTGYRGEEFEKMTYLQLGKYESEDQIAAAKYFATLPYIDKDRIGIWGWSYGGFMSSTCIAKAPDVFKTAIAVAPVTNWRYYDNIYTERYMRTPQENPSGYDDNSPVNMVKGIKGNYLLIHGSADDNVHFQNAMEMIQAMIKAGVEFDSEVYPDANHGISSRYHLYRRMTKFILEKL